MASVSDIAPLETTVETGLDAQAEITKLAETIKESATRGLKSATQAVVGNVPQMITDLTKEIQRGPIDSFAISMNKLVKLVDKLGINLRQYNEELADTVDEYRGSQEKLQQKLFDLREQGIKAEINQKGDAIKLITKKEAERIESRIDKRTEVIRERETEKRELLQKNLDTKKGPGRKAREDAIVKNEEKISKLKLKNEEDKKRIGKTADTGALSDQPGFGKLTELKEAFMIIPDTITEVFGGVKNIGSIIGKQFKGFLNKPMKTISKVFKNIGNAFRTFRILIALKILAVIAAFQWVVEHITGIGDVFKNIWEYITGFFKKIIDWFKNSKVGKFFGLGDDDEKEEKKVDKGDESRAELKQLYIKKHGEEEGSKMYNEWESEQDADKPKIIKKGRARKFETEKVDIQPQEFDMEVAQKSTQRSRAGGKKFLKKKEVVGQTTADGDTSKVLKELEAEATKELNKSVIQVNNNSTVTSQNQSGTTVSGFIDHEPDTSFKYIRNNNSDSTWI